MRPPARNGPTLVHLLSSPGSRPLTVKVRPITVKTRGPIARRPLHTCSHYTSGRMPTRRPAAVPCAPGAQGAVALGPSPPGGRGLVGLPELIADAATRGVPAVDGAPRALARRER